MIRNNRTISRNDYPIIIVILGTAVLVASLFSGNEFAFFIIAPLSVILIGVGAVLAAKRNDARTKGLAKHQRLILFSISMLLLAFFVYILVVIAAASFCIVSIALKSS